MNRERQDSMPYNEPDELPWADEDALTAEEIAERVERSAAARQPRRMPGQTRVCFSPLRLFALTEVPRDDIDVTDIDLFLTEEPLETIGKDGIMVGGEKFTAPALREFVTGDKSLPQRDLVIRYDRSRLARGILDEVRVLERDDAGRYHLRAVCSLRDEIYGGLDADQVIREQHRYLEHLLARRTMAETEYTALVAGTAAAEAQVRSRAARDRFHQRYGPDPMPATPIVAEPTEAPARKLGNAVDRAAAGSASRSRGKPGLAAASAPRPNAAQSRSAAPGAKRSSRTSLDQKLGGKTGF